MPRPGTSWTPRPPQRRRRLPCRACPALPAAPQAPAAQRRPTAACRPPAPGWRTPSGSARDRTRGRRPRLCPRRPRCPGSPPPPAASVWLWIDPQLRRPPRPPVSARPACPRQGRAGAGPAFRSTTLPRTATVPGRSATPGQQRSPSQSPPRPAPRGPCETARPRPRRLPASDPGRGTTARATKAPPRPTRQAPPLRPALEPALLAGPRASWAPFTPRCALPCQPCSSCGWCRARQASPPLSSSPSQEATSKSSRPC
mmetsp:Transcript_19268/g.73789  ORF Transcript_19268/g.73789 Transcript_19268/m.73789 type:complete len:257 (-) Transcript_19268:1304-2074(-)